MAQLSLDLLVRHIRRMAATDGAREQTDAQLLERFVAEHEEAAFAALVQRHRTMVLGVCRRILRQAQDAEDAFQATFLALVRQARSVGKQGSVGGWLYRVAYRIAMKAKVTTIKRKVREREAGSGRAPELSPESAWPELRPVLDEELDRLPEKYRLPVVLCYLEGKTYAEAARELFSADGKVLVSGSEDTAALVWDLTGKLGARVPPLAPKDLDVCWSALAGEDAARAYQTIRRLAASPTEAVPYLREHLGPVPVVEQKRLTRLIADLDSNQFAVREAAQRELETLGEVALPACRKALEGGPSAELRRRLQALVEKEAREAWDPSPGRLRARRMLEALETAGTPEAKRLLTALAEGLPEARLPLEAKASLERLAQRPAVKP